MDYDELRELIMQAGDGIRRQGLLVDTDDGTAIRLVMEGVMPAEALNDAKRSGWVHPAYQSALAASAARHAEQTARAALDRLDPDVGIAACLAGIDNPAAAVASLPPVQFVVQEAQHAIAASTAPDGMEIAAVKATKEITEPRPPEWEVADGYLYVRGVSSEEIANALLATRTG